MTYLSGYDVSKYQTPSDWNAAGRTFLVARASIGTTLDPQYGNHITKAKAAGLLTGAYHFNWDEDYSGTASPQEQARFFVKAAGDVDFLFLDVEGKMAFEDAESTAFIAEVHRLGKKVGLYMSASVFRRDGQDYDWVARWGDTPPTQAWEFWQFTSSAPATDGGRLDCNRFNGDITTLRSLSNRNTDPMLEYVSTSTPKRVSIPANTPILRVDGSLIKKISVDATKYSPLRVNLNGVAHRVIDSMDGDKAVIALVRASLVTSTDIVDTSPYTKAQLDAAVAAAAEANAAEVAALQAQIADAATAERTRIAQIEAARISAL